MMATRRTPAMAQMRGGDRHVVEEAEPHGVRALGVVTRGAHQGDPVAHLSGEDRLAEIDQAAGREPCGVPRAR